MGFKCKNCGSNLKYNIGKRKLECESCGSNFDVDKYKYNANGNISYGVYRCKSCGAELIGLNEEQAVFCSYCGTQAYLSEKTEEFDSPKRIIPFSKTKEQIKEEYQKAIKGQLFLPKEFKEETFADEFRGIYIPYWQTSVDIGKKEFDFTGHKSYTSGKYDYTEKYDIGVRFEGNYVASLNDASVAFDDTIADCISPFGIKKMQKFNEGYLAGFYADKANVSSDLYLEASKDATIESLSEKLRSITSSTINDDRWKRKLELNPKSDGIALLPVWFLTWRNKDRVAYSVANGQTGKIMTDLPVDYKEFFKYAGISTVILFLILSIFPIFVIPLRLAGISLVLLWISSYILFKEITKIKQIEKHDFDYGYRGKKKKKRRKIGSILIKILMWFIIFVGFCVGSMSEVPSDLCDAATIMIFMQGILTIFMTINGIRLNNKLVLIPTFASMIISYAAYYISLQRNPYDYVNYIISFICLAGLVMNALFCMYYINYLTTRPVPNFFTREGANHKYEAD